MREEEVDLGFANFGGSADGAKRLYPAPSVDAKSDDAAIDMSINNAMLGSKKGEV